MAKSSKDPLDSLVERRWDEVTTFHGTAPMTGDGSVEPGWMHRRAADCEGSAASRIASEAAHENW